MPFFMMSNRKISEGVPGPARADEMTYFVAPDSAAAKLKKFASWENVTPDAFRKSVSAVADTFPVIDDEKNEEQKHVSLFVHGYNNSWADSVGRYADLCKRLYSGPKGLGVLVLYTWPSDGSPASYLPDREDARDSANALSDALVMLHDHIMVMQRLAVRDEGAQCKAKISIIAHSMGNYVIQKALSIASKKLNNPQLITLIHQLVMVAADVDNDLFQRNEPDGSDGRLMSNVCYRIGALYTGLDQVLGASAGLKHFGTRRLGRSGLADRTNVWDNIFDLDVTTLIKDGGAHSAVFESPKTISLLRQILIGVDRTLFVV